MAGAIGKAGGSYATVNRSANYLGGAMQNAQDNAFRFRQERKVKEDEAKAEKEKIDNEINAGLGKISSDTTRFSTQNALIIDATHKLRNAVAEKANLYKNGKISKLDYDTFYANAKSQVDAIDQSAKMINTQTSDSLTQIKEGKVNPAFAEYMANAGNAYENNNISLKLKEDLTFESVLYDDNDNIIEVSDLSKFGVKTFTPITDYDLDKDLSEFVKTYPKVLNEEIKDNLKIGIKGTSPKIEKAIEEKVNSTLKDRNQMAIVNYKRTGKAVPDVTNPEDIKANKEYLSNLYNGLYATEQNVDEAYGGANYALNVKKQKEKEKQDAIDNAFREKQLALQKAKENRIAKAQAMARNKNIGGGVIKTLDQASVGGLKVISNTDDEGNIPKSVPKDSRLLSIDGMALFGSDGKKKTASVDNIYVTPYGDLVFEGRKFDEEGKESKGTWEEAEKQLPFINSIVEDYDDNGEPIKFKTYKQFQNYVIDKTGIKVKPKTTAKKTTYAGIDPKTGKAIYK